MTVCGEPSGKNVHTMSGVSAKETLNGVSGSENWWIIEWWWNTFIHSFREFKDFAFFVRRTFSSHSNKHLNNFLPSDFWVILTHSPYPHISFFKPPLIFSHDKIRWQSFSHSAVSFIINKIRDGLHARRYIKYTLYETIFKYECAY